jgi:hypothetical protein
MFPDSDITDIHYCIPAKPFAHNNEVTILTSQKLFLWMVGMILLDDSLTFCLLLYAPSAPYALGAGIAQAV